MTLNPRLPDELERLATDLRVDRLGDPHIAFVVLLYPDRHGSVMCVGYEDYPPIDMTHLQHSNKDNPDSERTSARLPTAELEHVDQTVGDLLEAIRSSRYRSEARNMKLSEYIDEHMTKARDSRQTYDIKRDLERADHEAKFPSPCAFCGERFTARGVKRHERTCWKNPDCSQYGPGGEMEPIMKDGKIIGCQQRRGVDRSQCARCPEARYRHLDGSGACQSNGCPCKTFVPIVTAETEDQDIEPIRFRKSDR